MSALNDLIGRIQDEDLRSRIQEEVDKLNKHKKFGLVFEEHLPECTILYESPVKKGATVTIRDNKAINDIYVVKSIAGEVATCESINELHQTKEIPVKDLVVVAQFGEPIYPYLKPIDSVCNAPDSDLWHTLIEADNYHALQLLEYLYAGKVDCIYIDPPYNTGARDWKYNNDYVDGNDSYRHSKWLSMMEKRLKVAKKILNPRDSVLIVTIDEKEYLHLGCLLEELFPEARMQMVSSVISQKTSVRKMMFSRSNEFIYFLEFGDASVQQLPLSDEWRANAEDKRALEMRWADLLRCGDSGTRARSPKCFYPILVTPDGKYFKGVGNSLPLEEDRNNYVTPEGTIPIWPIHKNGSEGCWGYSNENLLKIQSKGYLKLGKLNQGKMRITYLSSGTQKRVEEGKYNIVGFNEDGSLISDSEYRSITASTQWNIRSHDATQNGTNLIREFLGNRFDYPKSLYAVHDTIRFFVENKPNAIIVDFFAGSGTTLHATNLLNAEDGGKRRCIMITNNEVSQDEAKSLSANKLRPGDPEWEALGIAKYVTWPRTVCSIKGIDIQGKPLKGEYLTTGEDPIKMADGFKANAVFYKLGFLNKTSVALGRQFRELLPILWMKAGAHNECPAISEGENIPSMLVLPNNKFAVLVDEKKLNDFKKELLKYPQIDTVYIVTDSEDGYQEIASELNVQNTYQLYRDYLDNFKINSNR